MAITGQSSISFKARALPNFGNQSNCRTLLNFGNQSQLQTNTTTFVMTCGTDVQTPFDRLKALFTGIQETHGRKAIAGAVRSYRIIGE